MSARQQRARGDRSGSRAAPATDRPARGRLPAAYRAVAAARRRRARRGPAVSSIQRCTSSRPDRLRREVGKLVAAGERDMHLGDAPSGLRHVAQIGDLLLALAGMLARRQQALLLDEAVEIGRGHGPGIALILRRRRARRRPRCVSSPSTSSTLPSSAGVLAKPATSVRKRPISISGLMPGSSVR